uniref:CBM20 domain-containing protein n=1 Tax=Biomphalaria glabrata TaxID=6526 RepID=A0A2C9L0Z2_BIOGL
MKVKSTEIVLQFKVWCPSFNRIRHRLFLLGSLPELGAWNIYDALEAHPTADNHTWQVDVIVPHESTFEWVWLKTGLNRTGVEWERSTKRNRTVGYFSGVLHSVWANSEEVYLQSATFAEVTTYLSIDDGYTLVLTGSTPTTGLWDLAKAVPAIEFPKKSGFWKALVSFDALTSLDFQWAVVKEKDFTSVRQQEKVKHSITGRRCWMRIVAPWMLQVTGIVDISIINDTLDTVHGRTSVIVRERRKRIEEIISWTNDSNHSYMEAKNARRNFHVTTSSSESVERTKVSDIKRESSLNIIKQPAVRSNENLDELIQKNEERIVRETKTERFTKLLSDAYTELTNTLKGQGQTEMPPDPFTMDELDNLRQTASGQRPSSSDQPKVVLTAGSVDEFDSQPKIKKMADVRLELTGSEGYVGITSRHSSESDMEDATIAGVSSCTTQFSVGTPSEYILSNTHQCDVSSSMSHVVASDTGFTELAISWMSSSTNAPRLSPPQISQQEIQTPLADLDEGFSEAEATLVDRLDRYSAIETGRVNDKQRDTSPVLMTSLAENTRTRPQPEDTLSSYEDDTFALEEDDAHLDWLAERVQFEEDFYGTQRELGMHLDLSTLKDEPIVLPSLDLKHNSSGFNKTTPDQWSHPTPEPVIQGSPNYTFFDDTFSESLNQTRSSLRNLSNARAIAREIEEKWGAGLHSQEAIDYDLPGNGYSTESVYYDISGLRESIRGYVDIEDRRAIARDLERSWCQTSVA